MPQPLPGPQYGRDFYENRDASTGAFADALARIAFDYFRPESVVDVGCGVDTLLRHMKERGAQRILGIEGPWAQHELLVIEPHELIIRELSGDVQIDGAPFDLACSLEVAEHLPPEREAGFVKLLCSLSDVVVFAAAVPGRCRAR
jgi:2-polyprenyl-3-methyl-5-hydroxy-6-metoxy-1,4-benzoquinol methylase